MHGPGSEASGGTSDVVWWSRLAIWVGAVVLLTQSVTGRGIGFMTVLAVVAMSGGLLAFLGGLMWTSRRVAAPPGTEQTSETVPETPAGVDEPEASPQAVAPAEIEEAAVEPGAPAVPPEPSAAEPTIAAVPARIETIELQEGDARAGEACVYCGKPVQVGDLAAVCPNCGGFHHVACWTANRFHCATPQCPVSGSLEAPSAAGQG